MNIKDTLTAFEQKLAELDALEADYEKAKRCGDEIGMKNIVKAEEKLASEFEALGDGMDDSDLSEVHAELEQEKLEAMTDALRAKAATLNDFIEQHDKAAKAGNQLEAYRLMKNIRRTGKEIAHIDVDIEGL